MKKCDPLDDFKNVGRKKEVCSHEPVTDTKKVELNHVYSPLDTAVIVFVAVIIGFPMLLFLLAFANALIMESP
ncbi:hypothetical protein [Candidatus Erwinia dacicola]|uniref:Uncharacterized protein n=1 Tax=Candidatus Erwinia dacicola TaxID=252393 RepID=A0A1E7Z4Q5_9GAMM|nr:hypothetical protein [Candidatus Erwinia dacicola]OFC63598.1 hypothetical protein BBW68_00640 [Candidatus Erwinia dacicola]